MISKKIKESINGQEGQSNIKLINLREYLLPKIETKKISDTSLLNLYQNNYLNIEDKYLAHLSNEMHYEGKKIEEEDKKRVDEFNNIVKFKQKILQSYLKMRYVLQENQLIKFIDILIRDVGELQKKLLERKENEERILMEERLKEKEKKEKGIYEYNYGKNNTNYYKHNNIQAEKERKKKEKEKELIELNNLSYIELKKRYPENPDVKKIIEKREIKALPEIENFLDNIIIYIIPSSKKEEKEQSLSNYIQRNDFIYHILMSEENGNLDNNKYLLKENLCIYLTEAKYFVELDVYKIILKIDSVLFPNQPKIIEDYFYSYIEVEIMGGELHINYLNNKESPEYENTLNDIDEIKKIFILNLALKDNIKDNLSGANYIVNENCGLLNVFCIKNSVGYENEYYNYHGKIIALQSVSDSFKCDEIKINGNFRVKGAKKAENLFCKELIIGHATYDLENNDKNVKLKIATFSEFE